MIGDKSNKCDWILQSDFEILEMNLFFCKFFGKKVYLCINMIYNPIVAIKMNPHFPYCSFVQINN